MYKQDISRIMEELYSVHSEHWYQIFLNVSALNTSTPRFTVGEFIHAVDELSGAYPLDKLKRNYCVIKGIGWNARVLSTTVDLF